MLRFNLGHATNPLQEQSCKTRHSVRLFFAKAVAKSLANGVRHILSNNHPLHVENIICSTI